MDKFRVVSRASGAVVNGRRSRIVLPRLITPLTTVVLAALLTPSDFGVVAAALAVVSLGQIVVEMGMGAAVIQRRTQVDEAASMALWLSLLVGVALYGLLWALAPWIAAAYRLPPLSSALRVVGFSLVLSSLISIPNALLTRDLEFRRLFWVGAVPQVMTAVVSLVLAVRGLGYWSLILGYLAGRAANLVLVWWVCRWRPKLVFRRDLFRSLIGFSAWVFISSLESWLFLYADNLLVGYFYGAYNLGVYSLGFNLANLLPGMLIAPLAAVAYPAFSALQNEPRDVGQSLVKLQGQAAAILFPACFGLAAVAAPIVSLLYGHSWVGLGWTLSLLAIMPGISNLWSLNADAYRAVGRPDVWAKVAGAALLILFPLLFLGGRFDYRSFVVPRFIGGFSLPILNVWAAGHFLKIPLREQWHSWRVPALCAVVMFAAVVGLSFYLAPFVGVLGWVKLVSLVGLSAAIYIGGLRVIDREVLSQLLGSFKRLGLNQWT